MGDDFFPTGTWTHRRTVPCGVHTLHAHMSETDSDVALCHSEILPPTLCGTVVMLSKHGDADIWLRARYKDPYVDVTWQMRRNHVGKMEFRFTGYNDSVGPIVCDCVSGMTPLFAYAHETFGEPFLSFAECARAAILNEINERCLPARLKEMLPRACLKTACIGDLVETNRYHELPTRG